MKILIRILLMLVLPITLPAQDSVVTISPSMFDKRGDMLFLTNLNGWRFNQGSDTAWAREDVNIAGWKKLKPNELSLKYADNTGRVECWFRIKIKIDSAFERETFGLKGSTWAALDFYIDGKLVASQGNTGVNGMPYHENNPYGNPSIPVNLTGGSKYDIAVHFVDYVPSFPSYQLKSQFSGLNFLVRITGPGYNKFYLLKGVKEVVTFYVIWVTVCAILSLLFWFLYFQNPFEKNLLVISWCSTFITAAEFCQYNAAGNATMSFRGFAVYNFLFNVFVALALVLISILFARIFKRRLSLVLICYLVIFSVGTVFSFFLPDDIANPVSICLLAGIFGIGAYFIFTSWKNLTGAQWAIVAGTLLALVCAILNLIGGTFQTQNITLGYLFTTGYSLSFPLSLLVYVALRFKEIVNEVRANAQQVVRLSEEKKQQALNQQTILQEEVSRQTLELRTTLNELKSTQSQLIQSEKMASLGELTAGIAHEIQNPLNFVNNFSEVNAELIDELTGERSKVKGERNEQLEDEIINDIKQNLEKINQHGKRADAIVKAMLQHSGTSSGIKELTDINKLVDEYLRLAYHGFRAKDKSFDAMIETDFENSIGKISVISQDIGRVLLNLYNNAFYAVNEKKKSHERSAVSYEPAVTVQTRKLSDKVQIIVSDNGNGIPQNIVVKIFQPFFTTKPTGQGTGLGLSLAYDIVKAHGGEIKVETKEGEGSEFVIRLPAASNIS